MKNKALGVACMSIDTVEDKFWSWFKENENRLFCFEMNPKAIFTDLTFQLSNVNKDLTFELGPVLKNGKREFIISADGIKSAFPAVERLCTSIPVLEKWVIIKFRPRRNPINDLDYAGKKIKIDDVYYRFFRDKDPYKIGILLLFKEYVESEKELWGQIGLLLLDEALGEYDVETKIGSLSIESTASTYSNGALPLRELPDEFDRCFKN